MDKHHKKKLVKANRTLTGLKAMMDEVLVPGDMVEYVEVMAGVAAYERIMDIVDTMGFGERGSEGESQ